MKIYSTFPDHLGTIYPFGVSKNFCRFGRNVFLRHTFIPILNIFILFGIPVFAEPPSAESMVLPSTIPGPTPLPASSPIQNQLKPPNPGNEDATQNVNTAVPETQSVPGPPPPPVEEATHPGLPTAADPNALIPTASQTPAVSQKVLDAQKKEEIAKELVRYKAVKVQAEKNPAIRRMYDRAQKATNEEDYRAAMREYYRMLFKKIEILDHSLADKAKGMREAYLRKLAQMQIEPTIPLHPPPTPEPLTP